MTKILEILKTNCSHKEGESVIIIEQAMPDNCPEEFIEKFQESEKICSQMYEEYEKEGITVRLVQYETAG